MNSQLLLYINIFLGVVFVLYFLLGRGKQKQPTKLNVKANEDFTKSIIKKNAPSQVLKANNFKPGAPDHPAKMTVLEPENVIELKAHRARNLCIYFVYNGHEWEAHEVLGVPPGSSMHQVTEAYQKLIVTSDPSTFEFYESSYQAILKKRKDRL